MTGSADKGKGIDAPPPYAGDDEDPRERPADQGQQQQQQHHQGNIASRIGSSAAQLSRSLFTGTPEDADVAKLASSSTKGSARASGSAPAVSGSSWGGPQSQGATPIGGSFRAERPNEAAVHAAQAEVDFSAFLDNTSVFVPSEQAASLESAWSAAGGEAAGLRGPGASVAEQEARDGAEVVELLSGGELAIDEPPDTRLPDREMLQLRRALFGDDLSGNKLSRWDNVLNFIPDFVRPDPGAVGGGVNQSKSRESRAVLGVAHGPESERLWVEQWMDVLTSYDDQVWGDLGILARQAREELEQLEQTGPEDGPPETTAVRRLQQVLKHVRSAKL